MGTRRLASVLVGALALGACAAPHPVTVAGTNLKAGAETIAAADAEFHDAVARSRATTLPWSRCWFATTRVGALQSVVCGPVVYPDQPAGPGAFQTVDVIPDGGVVRVGPLGQSGIPLPPGLTLVRPDGVRPERRFSLAAPAPRTVDANHALDVSDVHGSLAAPGDGRLRVPGVAALITGVGIGAAFGSGDTAIGAAAGQRLVVIQMTVTGPPALQGPGATTTVIAGATRVDLPVSEDGTARTYAVSIPAGSEKVTLAMTGGGLTQTFDLAGMHRVDSGPSVLYRGETSSLDVAVHATQHLDVTVDTDTASSGGINIALDSIELAATLPASAGTAAPPPGSVELIAHLSYDLVAPATVDGREVQRSIVDQVPADRVKLSLPGAPPTPATHAGDSSGGFAGTYSFVVPDTTTAGTITVTPGTLTTHGVFRDAHSSIAGTASLPFTVPAPPPPPPTTAGSAPSTPTALGTPAEAVVTLPADATRPLATVSRTPLGGIAGGLVVLLVAAGLAAAVASRRRQRLPVASPAAAGSPPTGAASMPATPAGPSASPPPSWLPTSPPPAPDASSVPPVWPAAEGPVRLTPTPGLIPADQPVVRVLGPLVIDGIDGRPDRNAALGLWVYLAVHDDVVFSTDTLLARVWTTDLDPRTLRTYVSSLRAWAGAERITDAQGAGGYRLVRVTSDWRLFQELCRRAERDGAAARQCYIDALSLIRGIPFDGCDRKGFAWIDTETFDSTVAAEIERAALALGEIARSANDARLALAGFDAALLAVPTSAAVHTARIAAGAQLSPAAERRARHDARRALGTDLT